MTLAQYLTRYVTRVRTRRSALFRLVATIAAMSSLCAARSAAQGAVDSLTTAILSEDVNVRAEALSRILEDYKTTFPDPISQAVVALIKREAADPNRPGGDDFGEYIVDLCVAAVQTADPSTRRPLIALGGLGISSGIASFIVQPGPVYIPVLDSIAATSSTGAGDVLEAYALMYFKHGSTLTSSDSAGVLRRVFSAASSTNPVLRTTFITMATEVPLPELLPWLQQVAATDTTRIDGQYVFQHDAGQAVTTLQPAWNSLTKAQFVAILVREQTAACASASGPTFGHCQAMRAQLDNLGRHVDQPNATPATNDVKNFRNALDAAAPGLASELVALMRANADRVTTLLGP